ncbi:hypothetical protein JCM10212_002682 [Sporobolomyces blumeae]
MPDLALTLTDRHRESISRLTPYKFHDAPDGSIEPYLELHTPAAATAVRLLPSFPLILTPLRASDFPAQTECLNDDRVAFQLVGPPYPYSNELARGWAETKWRDTRTVFERWAREIDEYDDARARRGSEQARGDDLKTLSKPLVGVPFGTIRRGDTGEWLGDLGTSTWDYRDVEDLDERETRVKENDARQVGDVDKVWSFGYYLAPSYHSQGIMSLCLSSLLQTYLVPYLDAQTIRSSAFADNVASIRVQENAGRLRRTGETFWCQVSESRGGGRREEVVLEWKKGQE